MGARHSRACCPVCACLKRKLLLFANSTCIARTQGVFLNMQREQNTEGENMTAMTRKHLAARRKLARLGINTTADLDANRDPTQESRFTALQRLVGDDGALWVLNDLAISQCTRGL